MTYITTETVCHAATGPAILIGPELAKKAIQRALLPFAQSSDPGRVEFAIPPLSPEIKGVDLSTASEVVKVYGKNVFGLEVFDAPITLRSQLEGLKASAKVDLGHLEFKTEGKKLKIKATLELKDLRASVEKFRIEEPSIEFWAVAKNASLVPTKPGSTIKLSVNITITMGSDGKLKVTVAKTSSNVGPVLVSKFKLEIPETDFPEVALESAGVKFDADPRELKTFLQEMVPDIHEKVAKAIAGLTGPKLTATLQQEVSKFELPTSANFVIKDRREADWLALKDEVTRYGRVVEQDATRYEIKKRFIEKKDPKPTLPQLTFMDRISFFQYGISLGSLTSSPDGSSLLLSLKDDLYFENGKALSQADFLPFSSLLSRGEIANESDAALLLTEDYLNEKLSIRAFFSKLERYILPKGIRFDDKLPVSVQVDGASLIATVNAEIHISEMESFDPMKKNPSGMESLGPKAVGAIEKYFGKTGGVLKFQLPIRVTPTFSRSSVQLRFDLEKGMRSNLRDSAMIFQILAVQLNLPKLIQGQLSKQVFNFPTSEWTSKLGVLITGVSEPSKGVLAVGLKLE